MAQKLITIVCSLAILAGCSSHATKTDAQEHVYAAPAAEIGIATNAIAVQTDSSERPARVNTLFTGRYFDTSTSTIKQLHAHGIQFIEYGDTITLRVPTDRYYMLGSAALSETQFEGLRLVRALIKNYPETSITIAGFTDDIGSSDHKQKLSIDRARALLGYFWASGIDVNRMIAEGYGEHSDIASNTTVSGSKMNRRVEVQLKPRLIAMDYAD